MLSEFFFLFFLALHRKYEPTFIADNRCDIRQWPDLPLRDTTEKQIRHYLFAECQRGPQSEPLPCLPSAFNTARYFCSVNKTVIKQQQQEKLSAIKSYLKRNLRSTTGGLFRIRKVSTSESCHLFLSFIPVA